MVACGIDFGTSNTAVSLWRDGEVRPVAVDVLAALADTIPTLLFFPPDGTPYFGSAAVREYLSRDMAGRLIQSIKRYLPSKGFSGTVVGGRTRPIEELVGGFLAHVKRAVDAEAGEPVTRVLMGRPAVFDTEAARDRLAQDRLERAARLAGFTEVAFQLEPIAAARAFERSLDRDVVCLVGDLGGGTSDFTVIRLGPGRTGDRRGDVLGSAGVYVGGNDVDARFIQRHVLPHFGYGSRYHPLNQWIPVPTYLHMAATRWHRLCVEAITPDNIDFLDRVLRTAEDAEGLSRFREFLSLNYGYSLFRSVEATKVALSASDVAPFRFREGNIRLEMDVRRADLEDAISGELRKLERCMDGLVGGLGLVAGDVDVVFLTGGTSQIPAVQALFEGRFPGRTVARDAFTSVGLGLGVESGERFAA